MHSHQCGMLNTARDSD